LEVSDVTASSSGPLLLTNTHLYKLNGNWDGNQSRARQKAAEKNFLPPLTMKPLSSDRKPKTVNGKCSPVLNQTPWPEGLWCNEHTSQGWVPIFSKNPEATSKF